jgi:hypothetical protein
MAAGERAARGPQAPGGGAQVRVARQAVARAGESGALAQVQELSGAGMEAVAPRTNGRARAQTNGGTMLGFGGRCSLKAM